jgi:hypothetical protein
MSVTAATADAWIAVQAPATCVRTSPSAPPDVTGAATQRIVKVNG